LERLIRDSYRIISEYESTIQTSTRPEEKLRSERAIDAQWELIETYLEEVSSLVHQDLPPDISQIAAHFCSTRVRIFISYKRDVAPDESLAMYLHAELERAGHDVYIDRDLPIGVEWAEALERQIVTCDYMVVLLSEASVHSEMVLWEVRCAHENLQQTGRSRLLPVRLGYREPFQYPLNVYLDHLNWALWESDENTSDLVQEIVRAVSGDALPIGVGSRADILLPSQPAPLPRPSAFAQPVRLELPEGTMDPESAFYVERPGDRAALETIERQGVTITIKAPRQMGKSSLLIRIVDAAAKVGKEVAFLDFQLFEKSALSDADVFFQQFCRWLTDELDLDDQVDAYWATALGNTQRCTRYVGRYLLKALDAPLALAMDEVDSVFDAPFRTDFFGMLRSWHNRRRRRPAWQQLDLALVTSTEPYQLIQDLNQSPFNVGEVIELNDFTREQVADLNRRHGSPLGPGQERHLADLLNGHPYLTRRALYLVASGRTSARELFERACEDRGPFGDHLRHHLFRLHGDERLIQGLGGVIHDRTCADEDVFFRLRGAGLARREGGEVLPRCQLYADYFRERLHV
jgi:hypothetical protein